MKKGQEAALCSKLLQRSASKQLVHQHFSRINFRGAKLPKDGSNSRFLTCVCCILLFLVSSSSPTVPRSVVIVALCQCVHPCRLLL